MSLSQSHSILCNVPQATVYKVICESSHWPELFEPCISVEPVERNDAQEHIRITAWVGGKKMTWESRRHFRREIFSIDSEILKPMQLVKRMSTSWHVIPVTLAQCLLVLEHDYDISDNVCGQIDGVETHEQAAAFIANAIHENSSKELKNIRDAVGHPSQGVLLENRATSHSIVCNAPAKTVYGIITDVANWPSIFDACVSATTLDRVGNSALVRIEAIQSGKLVSWDTRRTYFADIFRIDFHLPTPMPFLKYMNGQWRVIPINDNRCVLHVTRNFALLDKINGIREDVTTHEEAHALISQFIEENAESEMSAIRSFVEREDAAFSAFKAKYMLPYAPEEVYSVLADVTRWPDILPHCEGVDIIYDDAENQEFVMHIRTPHGTEHFRSIRNCKRDELSISYFQPVPPAVLKTHRGNWVVRATAEGTEVISEHAVRVDTERCREMFGEDDLSLNKKRIKELIANNSKATVDACGTWLKQKRGGV